MPRFRLHLLQARVAALAPHRADDERAAPRTSSPAATCRPPDSLTQLAPGEQTRQDVQAQLLGTPATTAVFDNETWYYISGHSTQYAFFATTELDRTIYAVSFDGRGILKEVKKY